MDTNQGMPGIHSFDPSWSKHEFLEKTLAGRKELVDRLEVLAIDGAGGPNKHQRLIVGVRGSGKTHVLRVLYNRLWQNKEVKKRLLIVYLLEDEMGVASFLDFVMRMLRAIGRRYPEKKQLANDLEAIFDIPLEYQESQAVKRLLDVTKSKDVLVIVENLGIIFDDVKGFGKEGQHKLRDLVQQYPRFMFFASSQSLVEGTRKHDRPFYEFFKVIHLRRLDEQEAMDFLISLASAQNQQDTINFLNSKNGRARMRAVYEFTGGNHRLLTIFCVFLTAESIAKLSEIFMKAIGPLKPFYQEQMRSLSAQQQKIVQYLSLQRTPRMVKDIARACLAKSNTISRQLKVLLDRNFVSKFEKGRESYYEVTESLFRICYEADLEQEGAPVRLFIDFLANYYTAQELLIRHKGFGLLAQKLGNDGTMPFVDEAKFYQEAISLYYPEKADVLKEQTLVKTVETEHIHSFFQEMEESEAYKEIVDFSKHVGTEKDVFILRAEANAYAHLGDGNKAKATAQKALKENPDEVEAHIILSEVLSLEQDKKEESLKYARQAHELAPKDPELRARIGIVFGNLGNHEEALKVFEVLMQQNPSYSKGWNLAGQALHFLERTEEAEKIFRKALELDPKNVTALQVFGIIIGNTSRHEEALGLFERLTEALPDYAAGWVLTGQALQHLKRTKEAEKTYHKALELDPKNAAALEGLGFLVDDTDRHEEALSLFERLTKASPDYAMGWTITGQALHNLKRTDEAETAYRKALELDPKNAAALEKLGNIVGNTGSYEEALSLFERLTKVSPDYATGWALMGIALINLKQGEEAEKAFRKALELDPKNVIALEKLGVFIGGADRYEEALGLFERLTKAFPDYATGWALVGYALSNLKQAEEAEKTFRKALELDPKNVVALASLGIFVHSEKRYEEALSLFERLTKVSPDHAMGWRLTGQALSNLKRSEEAEGAFRKALELEPKNAAALEGLGVLVGDTDCHEEALSLFEKLTKVSPDYVLGWVMMGFELNRLKQAEEAEAAYRKALELDPQGTMTLELLGVLVGDTGRHEEALGLFERLTKVEPDNADASGYIAIELEYLGREQEGSKIFEKAVSLGVNRSRLLNTRGESRRKLGKYEQAITDYMEAIEADPKALWPRFNLVTVNLTIGNIECALEKLQNALEACKGSDEMDDKLLVQSFQENCQALFEHAPIQLFTNYSKDALVAIEKAGYLEQFEQSISLTVFALLRNHKSIEEDRFYHIIGGFKDALGLRMDVRVAVHFLQVGIDHFKKKDKEALLSLSREERHLFCKELGIEDPGEQGYP